MSMDMRSRWREQVSSSSSTERPLAPQIETSLRQIGASNPAGYRHLLDVVGELTVRLNVGDENLVVRFALDEARVVEDTSAVVDARVSTDRSTVASIIAGETSLAEAVFDGCLSIQGSVEVVARLYDGLVAYVGAVVGTPGHAGRFVA